LFEKPRIDSRACTVETGLGCHYFPQLSVKMPMRKAKLWVLEHIRSRDTRYAQHSFGGHSLVVSSVAPPRSLPPCRDTHGCRTKEVPSSATFRGRLERMRDAQR